MTAFTSVCQRMPACLKRIQPMPNVSVYQRVSFIRNSVTGPLNSEFLLTDAVLTVPWWDRRRDRRETQLLAADVDEPTTGVLVLVRHSIPLSVQAGGPSQERQGCGLEFRSLRKNLLWHPAQKLAHQTKQVLLLLLLQTSTCNPGRYSGCPSLYTGLTPSPLNLFTVILTISKFVISILVYRVERVKGKGPTVNILSSVGHRFAKQIAEIVT